MTKTLLFSFIFLTSTKILASDEYFIAQSWQFMYCGSKFNGFNGATDNSSPVFQACMDIKNQEIKIIDSQTKIINAQTLINIQGKNKKSINNLNKAIDTKKLACKKLTDKKIFLSKLKTTSGYTWFKNYICTKDCSGHEAGYEWAKQNNAINMDNDCEKRGNSFLQGCYAYIEEVEEQKFLKMYCSTSLGTPLDNSYE